MTKEKFKELYEKETCELSRIESAVNKLGFQMDGRTDVHKNVLSAFQSYSNSHTFVTENGSDKPYYAYIADEVADNWEAFHDVCFQLWNFSKMSMNSLSWFYNYIYSAFEMMEKNTFAFEDYVDEQFQTYMTNLGKFFSKEICDDVWNTFIDYLKDKNEWHEEFFKC